MSFIELPSHIIPLAWSRLWTGAVVSCLFAFLGRAARGVDTSGAVAGAGICFALVVGVGWGAFAGLCALFLLTWIATRFGSSKKQKMGTAESLGGRNAGQVLANLSLAAVCSGLYATVWHDSRLLVALVAVLAEAAADTTSSEIGQAAGGVPRMITSFARAPVGTDGAVTWIGTFSGVLVACVISLIFAIAKVIQAKAVLLSAASATVGLLADSFLGATLERSAVLGNNSVNFLSTAIAALIAFAVS